MSKYKRNFDHTEFEWTPELFGYMSIPIFILGVIFISFPDFIYKFFRYFSYREMKPNQGFEDYLPKKEIPRGIELVLKALGLIMISLGFIWFWFSKEFYQLWFN